MESRINGPAVEHSPAQGDGLTSRGRAGFQPRLSPPGLTMHVQGAQLCPVALPLPSPVCGAGQKEGQEGPCPLDP